MTETEQLKKNTAEQYARERANEVGEYLKTLALNSAERRYWKERSVALTLVAIATNFLSITILALVDAPIQYTENVSTAGLITFLVAMFRAQSLTERWHRASGELDGALTALQKAGMMKIDYEDEGNSRTRSKKKKALFPRFKEFFERMGSKDKREKYA